MVVDVNEAGAFKLFRNRASSWPITFMQLRLGALARLVSKRKRAPVAVRPPRASTSALPRCTVVQNIRNKIGEAIYCNLRLGHTCRALLGGSSDSAKSFSDHELLCDVSTGAEHILSTYCRLGRQLIPGCDGTNSM